MHKSRWEVRFQSKLNGRQMGIAQAEEKCGCSSGVVHVKDSSHCASHSFFLEEVSNSIYIIRSKSSGKVLDVYHESKKDGAQVQVYKQHGRANQLWILVREVKEGRETDCWQIQNVNSGKVLEVEGGINANGVKVVQNTNYSNENQYWRMLPVDFVPSAQQ